MSEFPVAQGHAEFGLILNNYKNCHSGNILLNGDIWSDVYNSKQGTNK